MITIMFYLITILILITLFLLVFNSQKRPDLSDILTKIAKKYSKSWFLTLWLDVNHFICIFLCSHSFQIFKSWAKYAKSLRVSTDASLVSSLLPCFRKKCRAIGVTCWVFQEITTNGGSHENLTDGRLSGTSSAIFDRRKCETWPLPENCRLELFFFTKWIVFLGSVFIRGKFWKRVAFSWNLNR